MANTNQGLRQESVRAVTGTTLSYNGDWLALFRLSSIDTGSFDGDMLSWINLKLSATHNNLSGAMAAYAASQGFGNWGSMGTFTPGVSTVNLLLKSQAFDDAAWVKDSTTVTANAIAAPDATTTADKLLETTATANFRIRQLVTITNGVPYTVSVYAKLAERSWLIIDFNTGTSHFSSFDLTNGVTGTSGSGNTASIVSAANGFYRCIVTRTTDNTGMYGMFQPATVDNQTGSYSGTAGSGIYIWGAQLESGSSATTYVPNL